MGSMSRKVARRMDEVARVMGNQHRSPVKELKKRHAKVEKRTKRMRAFLLGALHACGHEAYAPRPVLPLRMDRYHAGIAARGTTISPSNIGAK
jgi:hypothetical protein